MQIMDSVILEKKALSVRKIYKKTTQNQSMLFLFSKISYKGNFMFERVIFDVNETVQFYCNLMAKKNKK